MIKCLKCGAEMEKSSVFCGNCGNRLQPAPTVIDGKKRKHARRFFYHSGKTKKGAALFLAGFLLLVFLGVWILWDTLLQMNGLFADIGHAVSQLILKAKYLSEGVPLRYISDNIATLAAAATLFVDLIFSGFLLLFGGYFAGFYGYNLFLHFKYKAYYSYHKPVMLEKVSNIVMVLCTAVFLIFLIVYALLGLIQLIC